jgi:hypothetical protein
LKADNRVAVQACSSAKSSSRPGAGTTKAFTSSSVSSDGTATTATSSTSGCATTASSTSAGERFWPRRRSTSLRRDTKVNVPSAAAVTRSPVCSQPSTTVAAVSAGICQ